MATTTSTNVQQVMSTLFLELLNGQLTDETIAAVDEIDRNDVPEPMREVVAYMHGMTTAPHMRYTVISHVIRILGGELMETAEAREQNAPPLD